MKYNNTISRTAQEQFFQKENILKDFSLTGKDRKWRERKMANEYLALAYDSVDTKKANRLRECSKTLTYRVYDDGSKKLDSMNSCRVRLCPICSWRRSLKVFYTTRKIVDEILKEDKYRFVFLTLTMRNCLGFQLNEQLNLIFKSWNRFMQLKEIKAIAKGWYRGLEVTHDCNEYITDDMYINRTKYYDSFGLSPGNRNPNFDSYHPHIHCILVVNKSYFNSRNYLSQERISELWKQSCRLDYLPICDIRSIRGDYNKAVAEISKYASKPKDYIITDDWDLTIDTVKTLDYALNNRRLVAYGGLMKDIKKQLKLDDEDSGNLIDVTNDNDKTDKQNYKLETYFWYSGYRQYLKFDD